MRAALEEVLPAASHLDPAEQVTSAEGIRDLQHHVDGALSELETQVLHLHVDGVAYQEIGARLERGARSVDNALQRIRGKLAAYLVARDAEAA